MKTRRAYRVIAEGDTGSTSGVGAALGSDDKGRVRKNIGHWNPSQQALYYIFLTNHQENFMKKELRRTDKIFKEMAKFVKSRCPDQCRSHHQKMENKFPEFDDILNSLKLNCSPSIVSELIVQFQESNKFSNAQTTESEGAPLEEEPIQELTQEEGEGAVQPEGEETAVDACEEIALLTFDEIIELEQAAKPVFHLADELFDLGEFLIL